MKTNMKKLAAWMLALLLVLQMIPVFSASAEAIQTISNETGPIDEDEYRDKLKIMTPTSIVNTGTTVTLTATEGYTLEWTSNNEEVATVDENGVVTGLTEGKVKITAMESGKEGDYKDSLILKIVGAPVQVQTEEGNEDSDGNESVEEVQTAEARKVIAISINKKDKVVYDGQPHEFGFMAEGNFEGFDASKVQITDESLLMTGKDCGVYQTELGEESFTYDGETEGYEFIISDGWMRILPAPVTVKAEDKVRSFEDPKKIPAPEATTVTVTGLIEGEDPSLIQYEVITQTLNDGITYYIVDGEEIQNNYKVTYESGKVINDAPLYNAAAINGGYYRLKKTRITTAKDLKANLGKKIEAGGYETEAYDFDDLKITYGGKEYVYCCAKNAEAIAEGADYYTTTVDTKIDVVKNKIGALAGWLIPEEERFNDPNTTDSYHRNYTITLVTNDKTPITQDLYNMLSVNGNGNNYRLRKTKIKARPMNDLVHATVLYPGEYTMDEYDFSNVVLNIDGEEYKYSDHELEGEYDSYFTVSFDKVMKEDRINQKLYWFKDKSGWLDGAEEQFGNEPNETAGYHANYKATTHKGNRRDRSVTITSSWEDGKLGYVGLKITLKAHLTGFAEGKYRLQWQHSTDSINWINQPGADGEEYTYVLDETTTHYRWRVVAIDVK